jgi:hypothetical protein
MNKCSHALVSCLLLAGATALALAGCAVPAAPAPDKLLGEASQHLVVDQCIEFDVNGSDTICHHTGAASHPFTLIKISDQACINGHAAHSQDYITSLDPASSLFDPTCNGQGCLPAGAPCDGTLECCTGSCVSGTCAGAAEPTIGCHDEPTTSGSTGVDDLFYTGPIDTIDNVRFHRAPRDGSCTGDSFTAGLALISAASAEEAATKCQSITGGSAFDASIWDGLAGFWLCFPGGGDGGG